MAVARMNDIRNRAAFQNGNKSSRHLQLIANRGSDDFQELIKILLREHAFF